MDPKAWPDRVRRLQHGVDVLLKELDIPSAQNHKEKAEAKAKANGKAKGKGKAKAGSPRGDFACAHFGYSYGGGQKVHSDPFSRLS